MHAPRTLSLFAITAFALSGCDRLKGPDPAPAPAEADVAAATPAAPELPVRPESVESTAGIDWEAARRDMASVSSEDRGDNSFQVESGSSAAPVPVLLPTGIVVPQSAEGGVKFQPMSDGYFATYPGVDYDIVVNGTNEVIGEGESMSNTEPSYLATASGAQVAFNRYGAGYLIEFECKNASGESPSCIGEDEALRIARELVIAGTR
jgi:hypothetical protein